jgi:integrase/recombinase XerD
MSEERISPLRPRMIEDMTVRKFTLKTQNDYIRVVKDFTIFLGRSPDTASNEDLRRLQPHLNEKRVGAQTINLTISAMRFFFTVTPDRTDAAEKSRFRPYP